MSDENREKAQFNFVCRAQVRRDRGHGKNRCGDYFSYINQGNHQSLKIICVRVGSRSVEVNFIHRRD